MADVLNEGKGDFDAGSTKLNKTYAVCFRRKFRPSIDISKRSFDTRFHRLSILKTRLLHS